MLKLHYAPRTISVAVAIILEECGISASSGFAVCHKGLNAEALVAEADRRLYEDKARNKAQKAGTEQERIQAETA